MYYLIYGGGVLIKVTPVCEEDLIAMVQCDVIHYLDGFYHLID